MFARIAHRYDLNNRLHSLWRDQAWRRAAAAMADVQPGEAALDVACGTGDLTALLSRAAHHRRRAGTHDSLSQSGQIVGADFCPEMLQLARRKFPHLGIEWLLADAEALPLPDASFDAVMIAFGLRNLCHRPEALAEFRRLLRPGGRLVVLEFVRPPAQPPARAIAWFTRHVMAHSASAIAGEGLGAYDYLHRSVQSFLSAGELAEAIRHAGFEDLQMRQMAFGIVASCLGVKNR
jgi:demethylmenaquinone methyltransferase/2-methoxy-6-polyprenyl-1,4-benzoquinol methylase